MSISDREGNPDLECGPPGLDAVEATRRWRGVLSFAERSSGAGRTAHTGCKSATTSATSPLYSIGGPV